jgi:hypothetical protein
MPNIPLQQRAGRNIGVEVTTPYVQGAASPETPVALIGPTTLMEGREHVARTPLVQGKIPSGVTPAFGVLFNNTLGSINYSVFFVDAVNNEMLVGAGTVPANSAGPLVLTNADAIWALCPGEKIVLKHVPTPGG